MRTLMALAVMLMSPLTLADIVVVNYHVIVHDQKDYGQLGETTVSLNAFNEQMAWLKSNGYKSLSVSDLVEHMTDPTSKVVDPTQKYVVLTFDDGWTSQLYAIPALTSNDLTATFYIISSVPERGWSGYMNWEQVRLLHKMGYEIGSHMVEHHSEPTPEQAAEGIVESKAKLEQMLGFEIDTIAWPHGYFTPEMVKQAKAAGYKAALTVDQTWCSIAYQSLSGLASCDPSTGNRAGRDPFYIKRVFVDGHCNLDEFAEIVRSGLSNNCRSK